MSKEILGKLLWFNRERGVGEIRTASGQSHFFVESEIFINEGCKTSPGDWFSFQIACFSIYGKPAAIAVKQVKAQLAFEKIATNAEALV